MKPGEQSDLAALWDFAVELYGADGVAEACLTLQDDHGVNIPLLLFCAWAGARFGVALSSADVEGFDAKIREWHATIVLPLRTVRRRMKFGPAPGPDPATERLRGKLKEVELGAEKIELEFLEQIAHSRFVAEPNHASPTLAMRNIQAAISGHTGSASEGEAAYEALRRALGGDAKRPS